MLCTCKETEACLSSSASLLKLCVTLRMVGIIYEHIEDWIDKLNLPLLKYSKRMARVFVRLSVKMDID